MQTSESKSVVVTLIRVVCAEYPLSLPRHDLDGLMIIQFATHYHMG